MTIEYLKQAVKSAATGEADLEHKVRDMLHTIEQGGEQTER